MRTQSVRLALVACAACLAYGQVLTEESRVRILRFIHTESMQDIQEIATLIRSMTDMHQASTDAAQRTLSVRGTADQIALAEWLFTELDSPDRLVNAQPDRTSREYRLSGSGDAAVRLFYLAHAGSVQDLQEVATLVRSMADIRRVFTCTAPRALVLRGTADQLGLAEWLIDELDRPQQSRQAAAREYRMPGGIDDVARVFLLSPAETAQNLQEIATLVRSIGDIPRVFTYTGPRVLTVRGTTDQAALAAWLVSELDRPVLARQGPSPAAYEYRAAASFDNATAVRVFYLAQAERLQDLATELRSVTAVRRLFACRAAGAIVLRGTPGQIAQADKVIQERDR